jgi:hypothetical protein
MSQIVKNLLSVYKLICDNDVSVEFSDTSYFIKDLATQKIMLHGKLHNDLYLLETHKVLPQAFHASQTTTDL